jgi:hypothetical protein
MMQGGSASEHFFKQIFAGAPFPHSNFKTLDAQQAFLLAWPFTLSQVL